MAGLYFDFHLPLGLKQLVERVYGLKNPEQISGVVGHEYALRQWFSQPRVSSDPTTEVVTINFRIPLSVSEVSFEITRQSNQVEVWYQDRSNNWRPVLDTNRYPLEITLSGDDWYTYSSKVYPIVAKSVQIRSTRVESREMGDYPYPIGLKNVLIKRNIQDRNQGVHYLEDEQDSLGNVISKYVKDWDSSRAIDSKTFSYWKSAPQPDPAAVVSMYLDVRDSLNNPQVIDKLYIDPVYTGQHLNIYYSSDDTVGVRRLSPVTIMPSKDNNTEWRLGEGQRDLGSRDKSIYEFSGGWGTFTQQPLWVGCEWTPDFNTRSGPSRDPAFFNVLGSEDIYSPRLSYNVGARTFDLEFFGERDYRFYARCKSEFRANEVLRIVAGWSYDPTPYVFIRVEKTTGEVLAEYEGEAELPTQFTLDSSVTIEDTRGLLTSYIVKAEDYRKTSSKFFENPTLYVDPEPTLPDNNGNLPSSTLDDALYAVEWTVQEHGRGGTDSSLFTEKKWTPIWRDYVVEKGLHFFPRGLPMKYIKLEFTRLTPEPYPVYESGIEVQYKTFPVSVQQSMTKGPNLYVGKNVGGLFNSANLNGVKSINWFNPRSVTDAVKNVFGNRYDPVSINIGRGVVSEAIPHTGTEDSLIQTNYRSEFGVRNVYRRRELDPYVLSQNKYETIIRAEGLMKISPFTNIPWEEIYEVNRRAFQTASSPGALPLKGSDYWIFPGQTLQIPASVMKRLTSTSTVTDFYANDSVRTRFTTSTVHRYETRTVKRDAGVAYFAGVREVTPMMSTYIDAQDAPVIKFDHYLQEVWDFTNIHVYPNLAIGRGDDEGPGRFTNMVSSMSYYTKASLKFHDSGLFKSNPMWLDKQTLSSDTSFFPSNFDGATWSDLFATWRDDETAWGAERSQVQITLDNSRQYRDRQAIRFKRAEGAGEAGVRVLQTYNLPKHSLTRIVATVFRVHPTTNEPLLRLVRKSDEVIVHSQVVHVSPGSWNELRSDFFEVPTDDDYYAEFVLTGDTEEEIYLSDLSTETSHVRYFVSTSPFFTDPIEVTELNYARLSNVVFDTRVDHFYIIGMIVSDIAYAYSCEVRPDYLQ